MSGHQSSLPAGWSQGKSWRHKSIYFISQHTPKTHLRKLHTVPLHSLKQLVSMKARSGLVRFIAYRVSNGMLNVFPTSRKSVLTLVKSWLCDCDRKSIIITFVSLTSFARCCFPQCPSNSPTMTDPNATSWRDQIARDTITPLQTALQTTPETNYPAEVAEAFHNIIRLASTTHPSAPNIQAVVSALQLLIRQEQAMLNPLHSRDSSDRSGASPPATPTRSSPGQTPPIDLTITLRRQQARDPIGRAGTRLLSLVSPPENE